VDIAEFADDDNSNRQDFPIFPGMKLTAITAGDRQKPRNQVPPA
jgi:hypothetical protein